MIYTKKENLELEYRMYGLVPFNISPIQQAIQYGHALQEYNNMFFKEFSDDKWKGEKKSDDFYKFQKWANVDKTFIILNGGTTNKQHDISTGEPLGTLNQHLLELIRNRVKFATFTEPDLNDALTAVVFLVDERVFDKKKYPELEEYLNIKYYSNTNSKFPFEETMYNYYKETGKKPELDKVFPEDYKEWVIQLGGEKNLWLREFTSQFKLA